MNSIQRREECVGGNLRLPQDSGQSADLHLPVQWHHGANCPFSHHHMAAALADLLEPKPLETLDDVLS